MAVIVAPSMLSADFANLGNHIDLVNSSSADLFHLDIMDGVFVPNISYGFPLVETIAARAKKPLDAHLMIVNPERYIERFAQSGVDYLSVHIEASVHLHRTLQQIRDAGMKAGVALNPHTNITSLEYILEEADYILIMSVNPGFASQKFIQSSISKIERLKEMIIKRGASCLIEVDGGVNGENAGALVKAGADILVAGSYIFGSPDPLATIDSLTNCSR